jgi:hypothetical protein
MIADTDTGNAALVLVGCGACPGNIKQEVSWSMLVKLSSGLGRVTKCPACKTKWRLNEIRIHERVIKTEEMLAQDVVITPVHFPQLPSARMKLVDTVEPSTENRHGDRWPPSRACGIRINSCFLRGIDLAPFS